MLKETTYNTKELRREISNMVGRPLSVLKRFKIGGNGSQRLVIIESFKKMDSLLDVDNRSRFCNIEIRESGLMVHFRSRLETFAWLVPFHLMSIFKSDEILSIFSGADFVRLKAAHNSQLNQKFIKKILDLKAEYTLQNHHNLQ
jgi:hypothetical protein